MMAELLEQNPPVAVETNVAQRIIHAVETPESDQDSAEQAVEMSSSDDAALEDLSRLSAIEFDRVRKKKARDLGINVKTLDLEVKKRRPRTAQDNLSGQDLTPPDCEPWHERVDGATLLNDMCACIKRFAFLPAHAAETIAVWILFTYVHEAFHLCPMLCLSSPEKRCGKTTVLSILSELVHRPLPSSNITPASVFRTIEVCKPTFLIDEADTFLRESPELRGIINSGHTRTTAFTVRLVGDDHTPRKFSTWCPKVIALIGKMHSTLSDRSVTVQMKRKLSSQRVERMTVEGIDAALDFRMQCVRWSQDNVETIKRFRITNPDLQNDRAADNWGVLLTIANVAGGDWTSHVIAAAMAQNKRDDADESGAEMLLTDIRDILETSTETRIPSADLVKRLNELEDRPWPDWNHGKGLTANVLAKKLKAFDIAPKTMRIDEFDPKKGYEKKDFVDAFNRYLPETTVTPLQPM